MKKIILSLFVSAFTTVVYTQNLNLEWVKSVGSTAFDWGTNTTADTAGNIYVTGGFRGSVDFDPGPLSFVLSSNGNMDGFVLKLDSKGNFIWAKSFGGIGRDEPYFITTDPIGNVYLTGIFENTVDFNPGTGTFNLTSNGNYDAFSLKLDSAGNFNWANSVGKNGNDYGKCISVDDFGNVYAMGIFRDTVDFDPGSSIYYMISQGITDTYIQKFNSNGLFIWAKSIGGKYVDNGVSIATVGTGSVYIVGDFDDTADFDPDTSTYKLASTGGRDIFILKLDSAGQFKWAKSTGGFLTDGVRSFTTDAGHLYISGIYAGTTDFDPSMSTYNLTSNGNSDAFVMKLENDGTLIWAKSFGGANIDVGRSISLDSYGNVFLAGYFKDSGDFNPDTSTFILSSKGDYDGFIVKLDANGNFIWAKSMGSTGDDAIRSITIDGLGNAYTTGYFNNNADLDPGAGVYNVKSKGNGDIFIQKLSKCGFGTGTDIVLACNSYTWIDGNTYTTSNYTATDTLINVYGCDSIVTLELTIPVIDVSTALNKQSITSNAQSASYQWVDCNNNYAFISGDTNQTFTASQNGNYAVIVGLNGCSDTSDCIQITGIGINELNQFNFSINPNPTTGQFIIEFYDIANGHIKVYNSLGSIVYSEFIQDQKEHVIALPYDLENGLYVVKAETQETVFSQKLLLNKY